MEKERILIVLWTTGRCNLQCKYCYASAVGQETDMDWETAAAVLDYFAGQSVKIQFAGGEPLLNFKLIEKIYAYIRRKGIDAALQLQTNGTLIDTETATVLKTMKMAVGVSLDGPPSINEYLRGGTKQTVSGIQALAGEGIIINLNSVVTAQNVHKLPELADFALYLGNVAGIGLDILREVGRAIGNSALVTKPTGDHLKCALMNLHQRSEFLTKKFGKKVAVREIEEAKLRLKSPGCNKNYCYAACGHSYVVLPNGDVYPCGSLIDGNGYYMGNIHRPPLKNVALAQHKAGKCAECGYNAFCPGGCPSRLIVNADDSEEETLDCVLKKTAFEIALHAIPVSKTACSNEY